MNNSLPLKKISSLLEEYSTHSGKRGASRKLNRSAGTKTIDATLLKFALEIQEAGGGKDSAQSLAALKKIKAHVIKLENLEKKKGSSSSILHKTNFIADLFRSFVDPSYKSMKRAKIEYARYQLKTLSRQLDIEIKSSEEALANRKFDGEKYTDQRKIFHSILEERRQISRSNFSPEEQKRIDLYCSRSFNDLINKSSFKKVENKQKVVELNELWKKGCDLLKGKDASDLTDVDKQKVMEFLLVRLNVHPSLYLDEDQLLDNELPKMMDVAAAAIENIANPDLKLLSQLTRIRIQEANEEFHLTTEILTKAKIKANENMPLLAVDEKNEDSNLNPWKIPPYAAKFYVSESFEKAMKGKAEQWKGVKIEDQLLFLDTLRFDVSQLLKKHQGAQVVDGDESLDVVIGLILKLDISPDLLLRQADLKPEEQGGPEDLLFTQLIISMRYLTQNFSE